MQMLIITSSDGGKTFGAPRSVAESVRATGLVMSFFGMVNGVQLASPTAGHAGRIVLPGWALLNKTNPINGKYDVSGTAMMYSDTGGASWKVSEVLTKGDPIDGTQPSESTLVELANGSLLVNIRDSLNIVEDKDPERCGCRLLARSDDGGASFATVWEDPGLMSGSCAGAMLRSTKSGQVFFVNPHSRRNRVNGTVMVSAADGDPGSWRVAGRVPSQNWVAAPGRPGDTFNFGYSAMALLPHPQHAHRQMLGVAYQNGWIANGEFCPQLSF